jgi:hypothetical protein
MKGGRPLVWTTGIIGASMAFVELFITKEFFLWPLIGITTLLWTFLFYKNL